LIDETDHLPAEGVAKDGFVMVFEGVDQFPQGFIIRGSRPGEIKVDRIDKAVTAYGSLRRRVKRTRTSGTEGRMIKHNAFPAPRAEDFRPTDGIFIPADQALGGINQIEDAFDDLIHESILILKISCVNI
jgi:hypothetical protein